MMAEKVLDDEVTNAPPTDRQRAPLANESIVRTKHDDDVKERGRYERKERNKFEKNQEREGSEKMDEGEGE